MPVSRTAGSRPAPRAAVPEAAPEPAPEPAPEQPAAPSAEAPPQEPVEAPGTAARGAGREPAVRETGIVFQYPRKVGAVELRAVGGSGKDRAWRGRVEEDEDGELLGRLVGSTAAGFQDGFEMPGGSRVMYMNFSVASTDGRPAMNGTMHRVTVRGRETSGGTYFYYDRAGVKVHGLYEDSRERGSDRVVREYREARGEGGKGERRFRVSFRAKPGTPIPDLPGWEPSLER
jgi:hypothetical protein